ncbi:hypothetical protein ACFLXB_02485 [Chloroflexota bacterium]
MNGEYGFDYFVIPTVVPLPLTYGFFKVTRAKARLEGKIKISTGNNYQIDLPERIVGVQ